eukprot:gene29591-35720_t
MLHVLLSRASQALLALSLLQQCRGMARGVPFRFGPLNHLSVSKLAWREVLRPGSIAVDATCGNGFDAVFLAGLCLTEESGMLHCIDIQQVALQNTQGNLEEALSPAQRRRVRYHCQSHATFPSSIEPESVSLVVYNLGYLPSSANSGKRFAASFHSPSVNDKSIQTSPDSTLVSILASLRLVEPGGMVSVTTYPANMPSGMQEHEQVKSLFSSLDESVWRVHCLSPLNRPLSPHLFTAFKIDKRGLIV